MGKDWALLEAMEIPQMKTEFNTLIESGGYEKLKPNFTHYDGKNKSLKIKFINEDGWNKLTSGKKIRVLNYFYAGLNTMFPERIKQISEFKV